MEVYLRDEILPASEGTIFERVKNGKKVKVVCVRDSTSREAYYEYEYPILIEDIGAQKALEAAQAAGWEVAGE